MSPLVSGNSSQSTVYQEDVEPYLCMDVSSFIWQTIGNIFTESNPEEDLTYQRKVLLVSTMVRSSFKERLKLLEDLGWQIRYDNEIAVHPKGQIYPFDEIRIILEEKLAKILKVTCIFAETIGFRYESAEGLFTNGEDIVSMEILGAWAKNRQL